MTANREAMEVNKQKHHQQRARSAMHHQNGRLVEEELWARVGVGLFTSIEVEL